MTAAIDAIKAKLAAGCQVPTPTPIPTPTPSPSGGSPSPVPPGPKVNLNGAYFHNSPGNSTLFGCATTNPAQPGAAYTFKVTRPDSTTTTTSGNLDDGGRAQVATNISVLGNYTEEITVTTSAGPATATTTVNVTSAQGQNGCGFAAAWVLAAPTFDSGSPCGRAVAVPVLGGAIATRVSASNGTLSASSLPAWARLVDGFVKSDPSVLDAVFEAPRLVTITARSSDARTTCRFELFATLL